MGDLPPETIGWLGAGGIAVSLVLLIVLAWRWHSKD
jgi:hypothetical protein